MAQAPIGPAAKLWRHHGRALLAFALGTAVALGGGGTLAARALMGSYQSLEDAATRQRAEQVYRAFAADLKQLQISNRDYAEWDTAQEFMLSRDPAFVAGNFSATTLLSMHVDMVWIIDAPGNDVYSAYVDRESAAIQSPAPSELRQSLRRFMTSDTTVRGKPPAERTITTPFGLAGVAATEITRSDGSGATGGIMLFARLIAAEEIARTSETSQLPVTLLPLGVGNHTASLPPEVLARSANGTNTVLSRIIDHDTIAGYALIRNVDGAPVAVFATESERSIYALGWRTTAYLLGSVGVMFVAFGAILSALLVRLLTLEEHSRHTRRQAEEQQRANRRHLINQAQRDFLTGLPNRFYIAARMPRLIAELMDSSSIMAVFHIDIDHFKNINDSRGHGSGDMLLRIVAKRLRSAVSKADLVARMGGDEFIVVASSLRDIAAIEKLAAHLHTAITADVDIDDTPVRVTASIGIALYPRDGIDMETLLKRADIALYRAKENGRRGHCIFSAEMDASVSEAAALEQELRRAIGTKQIYLDYQPIIDLKTGLVVSLEALMRWRHPERGLIPPAQFIPLAEKNSLILELGQIALEAVLDQQRQWIDEDVPVVPIAVNVSALQVERVDFATLVARLTAAARVDAKWVRFEITESAMTKEPEKLIGTLEKLRALGSQVLLDDFGTGYSSLSYIDRLPIDIIKIDRAFMRDLGQADKQSPVIPAVVEMARRLGLKTVAEGVENAVQAAALCELGCDYAQGYFYSRPVLARHCRSLLEHLKRERPLSDTLIARVVDATAVGRVAT